MSRRLTAVSALALALPAWAAAAPVRDADDSAGRVDLAEVQAAHNRTTDRLVHQVGTHGAIAPRDLATAGGGPPGSLCLNLWTTRKPRRDPPNYEVCLTANRKATAFKASIARIGTRSVRRVGRARVEQVSPSRLAIRFDPDRVRRPESYRWSAQATSFGAGCPAVTGCQDFAPDRPSTVRTTLGQPRAAGR